MSLVRPAIVVFIAVVLQRSAASGAEDEPSSVEVSLDSVVAFLPSGNVQKAVLAKAKEELVEVEASLMSLLNIVPGGDGKRFSAPAVRFALHKHFVRQYGWHLKGLEPAGAAWNSASPLTAPIFRKLPAGVMSLFESRFKDGGLLGREVAVLAATLELLVHVEARSRLKGVMAMLNISRGEEMTDHKAGKVRDWYMTSYMHGSNPWTTPRSELNTSVANMPNIYGGTWPDIVAMVDDIMSKQQQQGEQRAGFGPIVEEIGHSFGPWQNRMCSESKTWLMEMHDDGTGRVPLSDFYNAGLHGKWQFQESVEYLKKLGSLDMSNPSSPRVIIPNYVLSPSNCWARTETHDVCCISECEQLMAHLERELGAPTALPARILEVVTNLPSSTMPAGRQLPTLLVNRLHAVAAENDGVVPLTGRLFAQWLHHAYPRECPYPHVAGTTSPVNIDVWESSHAAPLLEDISVMKQLAGRQYRSDAPVLSAPWEQKEELLDDVPHSTPVGGAYIHMAVACAATFVAAVGLLRSAMRPSGAGHGTAQAKVATGEPSKLEVAFTD